MKVDVSLFEFGRRKVAGFGSISSMTLVDTVSEQEPDSVYLNEYGSEVHVNGPNVVPVGKPESLREKIARFDALAARVRESRAIMAGLASELEPDDDDEDLLDDSFVDDGDDYDSFGDIVERPNLSTSASDGEGPAVKPAGPQQPGPASEPVTEPSDEGAE